MLGECGVRVLRCETEAALRALRVVSLAVAPGVVRRALAPFTVCGKWMVFVPSELRVRVLVGIVDRLRRRLVYAAKTVGVRESRREQPVIVYVPSFLAPSIVCESLRPSSRR